MKRLLTVLIVIYLFTLATVYWVFTIPVKTSYDAVSVNDIICTLQDSWPNIDGAMDRLIEYDVLYLVVGVNGEILGISREILGDSYSTGKLSIVSTSTIINTQCFRTRF